MHVLTDMAVERKAPRGRRRTRGSPYLSSRIGGSGREGPQEPLLLPVPCLRPHTMSPNWASGPTPSSVPEEWAAGGEGGLPPQSCLAYSRCLLNSGH